MGDGNSRKGAPVDTQVYLPRHDKCGGRTCVTTRADPFVFIEPMK